MVVNDSHLMGDIFCPTVVSIRIPPLLREKVVGGGAGCLQIVVQHFCTSQEFLPQSDWLVWQLSLGFLITNLFTEAPQATSKVFLYKAESMATDVPFPHPPHPSLFEGGLVLGLVQQQLT